MHYGRRIRIYKESFSYKVFKVFNFIFMLIIFAVMLLPYLHVLAKALNDGNDTMLGGLTIYPRKLTFANFAALFRDHTMIESAIISIVRVVVGTVLSVATQFAAAYALSKRSLFGRSKIMLFLAIPMFFSGGIIPTYILYVHMGLINNFWVYILPGLCSYYNVMIIQSYIESSVPGNLREAALLDGAGEFTTMYKIVFPLCKPVVATVALWLAVYHWNDWNSTLMYVTKEKLFTLQYKLMQLIKESERLQKLMQDAAMTGQTASAMKNIKSTPDSMISAQVIVTTLPIIAVYPFLQKYFMKGITLGAVK